LRKERNVDVAATANKPAISIVTGTKSAACPLCCAALM